MNDDDIDGTSDQWWSLEDELQTLYPDPVQASEWLRSPQKILGGRIPEEMIDCGLEHEVYLAVKAVNDGVFP